MIHHVIWDFQWFTPGFDLENPLGNPRLDSQDAASEMTKENLRLLQQLEARKGRRAVDVDPYGYTQETWDLMGFHGIYMGFNGI